MIDLLGIINARDFHDSITEDIRVVNNNKCPFIEYQKEGGKEINTINKVDPLLARASDLDYLLRIRNWNTPERKFIDGRKNLCIMQDDGTLDYIPTIYITENEGEYRLDENSTEILKGTILNSMAPGTTELIDDITFGDVLSIDEEVEESEKNEPVINGMISPINKIRKIVSNWRRIESNERKINSITEDTLHNILSRNLDKISGGSVDLICFGSGTYTNILNLNHYLEVNADKVDYSQSIIAKLGIKYTKKNQEVVDRYYKEISFFPFTFSYEYETQIRKAVSENFIREINNDIVVEYINGCIRLFPLHSGITECIISFCNLNYE